MGLLGRLFTTKNKDRVAIFIDGSNLYHSLEENCKRFDLDFGAFAKKLCNERTLVRVYYYNIRQDHERKPQAYLEQQGFLAVLDNTPLVEVRLGVSKVRGDVLVEKGVDVMIATDLLEFGRTNMYDIAILVSGDGDFVYALQAVKNMGKSAEVAAFYSNLAPELGQIADERHVLNPNFFRDLWRGHRRRYPGRRPGRRPSRPTPTTPSEKPTSQGS